MIYSCKVISLPFDPKFLEITRMNVYTVVRVDEDAVYMITSSIIPDIIASFLDASNNEVVTHQNLNLKLHDLFSIPNYTQGEITFNFITSSGAFLPNFQFKFSLNLRFSS